MVQKRYKYSIAQKKILRKRSCHTFKKQFLKWKTQSHKLFVTNHYTILILLDSSIWHRSLQTSMHILSALFSVLSMHRVFITQFNLIRKLKFRRLTNSCKVAKLRSGRKIQDPNPRLFLLSPDFLKPRLPHHLEHFSVLFYFNEIKLIKYDK